VYRDTHLAQKHTVTGKNRAIPGLHRDSFPGLTGQVQGRLLRQVTFTHYIAVPLAARQIAAKFTLYLDFRRARKSFEALPCNRPVASKHMLFCPPGLRHLDKFIVA
jgi:hypothetical protein